MNMLKPTAAAVLSALCLMAAGAARAQAAPELTVINQYRQAFLQNANGSGVGDNAAAMDQVAQNPAGDCMQRLNTAKRNAAQEHVRRALPPDPSTFIRDTTCIGNVAQQPITIVPGIAGVVLNFILQYVNGGVQCGNTTNFWDTMVRQAANGQYDQLARSVMVQAQQAGQGAAQQPMAGRTPVAAPAAVAAPPSAVVQQAPAQQPASMFGLLMSTIGGN